ncbi:hypothetical protein T484DRAFT_1799471, partial [Baffinella frigidus]
RPAVAAPVAATKPAAVSTAEDATSTGEAPPLATASDQPAAVPTTEDATSTGEAPLAQASEQGAVAKDPAEDRVTAALESR